MLQKIKKQNKGFSLLELLLAIAIFSMASISVGYLIVESVRATDLNTKKIQSTFYAKEGIEAVRSIRDIEGFAVLAAHLGNNGLAFNSSTNRWSFSGPSDTTSDNYLRVVRVEGEGDYIKITSTASTDGFGRNISTSLVTYFSDWR